MKIDCIIDGKNLSRELNSHMPLSELIRQEQISDSSYFSKCNNKTCLNCIVLVEDKILPDEQNLILACLTPVFKINNMKITTKETFLSTENAVDIIDVYNILNLTPCPHCYVNKTMIFSFIVNEYIKDENFHKKGGANASLDLSYKKDLIFSSLALSKCNCLSNKNVETVIDTAIKIRRNKNV